MKKIVVIHYSEIAIKGDNRVYFEKQLVRNIKRSLSTIHFEQIKRLRGRIVIYLAENISQGELSHRLKKIFGSAYFSFGVVIEKNISSIKDFAWRLMSDLKFDSFCIRCRRSQKEFTLNSMQINEEVGAYIQQKCGKKVDLNSPDAVLHIDITERGALLFTQKIEGLRGLPVGVSERAVSLLSSGIDSPVASYMMLKRGVNLVYAHFHSQPYTSPASQENTEKLIEVLTELQYYSKVYFIPFVDIQKEIMTKAPPSFRVILYRRYMVRLAEKIAIMERCNALVTGENVGQVASQTISNIRVVADVTRLPVLRPLAGFDKEEIVQYAKKIGTFEISTAPYEDCCSLFVPDKPATKARSQPIEIAEKSLEIDALMHDAMARAEIKQFKHQVE